METVVGCGRLVTNDFDQILSFVNPSLALIDSRSVCGIEHLKQAAILSLSSHSGGFNLSKDKSTEVLLYLTFQRQRQSKIAAEYEPKIKEMQGIIEDQTEKYERLLSITQEMEDELDLARQSLHARDGWFNANISSLESVSEIIKEWRNIQGGKFPEVKESSGPGGGKSEFVASVAKIKGLGAVKAENLYDAGFHSVEDLKSASTEDIAGVVGFTNLSASKVVKGAKEL